MIENRSRWLEAVFSVEGGYVNDPADPGKATNMGITIGTLGDWRGEPVHNEDVAQLGREEAEAIYLARYWQVMRGDQLPGGLDVYAADFAVGSGPARAAKELQQLVGTPDDGFVGPLTLEAIRAKDPLALLLDYDTARMRFLLGLKNWGLYGRGWTNRCNVVCSVARSLIQKNPASAEAAGSSIIKAAAPAGLGSSAVLAYVYNKVGPQIVEWLQAPDSLERLQTGASFIGQHTTVVHVIMALSTMLFLNAGALAFIIWRRTRMWKKGKV